MSRTRRPFASRASRAFSSLAISCAIAILSLLALTVGALQDSRAEGMNAVVVNTSLSSTRSVPVFPAALQAASPAPSVLLAGEKMWISRRPVAIRDQGSPVKEFFGFSKMAFPLLVSDLAPVAPGSKSVVMAGRTVGVR
ncbi:MAG: hypothetical protein WCJ18_03960 [Planctomycetota bacterium]